MNRVVQIVGHIDEEMFKHVDAALTDFEAESDEPIHVRLSSDGGTAYDGPAVAARLRSSPCHIVMEGFGCVFSAATAVFAAGDERKLSKYAVVMLHQSTHEFNGDAITMKKYAAWCIQEELLYCQLLADYTNTDQNTWKRIIASGRDKYLTAEDALQLGLATSIF